MTCNKDKTNFFVCLLLIDKMGDVSKGEGRTVLFVSHNLAAVRELCNKGMLLENGRLKTEGDVADVINSYYNLNNKLASFNKIKVTVNYEDNLLYWAINKNLKISIENLNAEKGYFLDISFNDKFGTKLFSIEGTKSKVPLKLDNKLELLIINPGIVDSYLSIDVGLRENLFSGYKYLETSILQIPTIDLDHSEPIKGLIIPKIYFKNEGNLNEFRLLD